jgi:prevent-host-death family protein
MTLRQKRNTVSADAAKTRFSQLLEKVEAGEEIIITKLGAPVARLVPASNQPSSHERAAAIQRIRTLASGLSLGGQKVKDLIRHGRR